MALSSPCCISLSEYSILSQLTRSRYPLRGCELVRGSSGQIRRENIYHLLKRMLRRGTIVEDSRCLDVPAYSLSADGLHEFRLVSEWLLEFFPRHLTKRMRSGIQTLG